MSIWYCRRRNVITGPEGCCDQCELTQPGVPLRIENGVRVESAGASPVTRAEMDALRADLATVARILAETGNLRTGQVVQLTRIAEGVK